jgi:hypothetical protein
MSMVTALLTNFTSGELSPRLEGRVDVNRYQNGCRRLENFLVHPHGGATRRSGLRFVGPCGSQSKASLLLPFEQGQATCVLEFFEDGQGQGRMRVFAEHGRLQGEGGEPFELAVPYAAGDLSALRWAQSDNTLVLVHPDFAPRRLTRLSSGGFAVETMTFTGQPGQWGEDNWPSQVCWFEGRLVFAATPEEPSTLWFSRTNAAEDFRLKTREVPLEGWSDHNILDANADGKRDGKENDTFVLLDGEAFEAGFALRGEDPAGGSRYFRYIGTRSVVASGADKTVAFKDSPESGQVESVHDASGNVNASAWEAFEVGARIEAPPATDPLDDDAVELTLAAGSLSAIRFLVPKARLWIGTAGGEWTIGGGTSKEPVTPSGAKASREGTSGAAEVAACPVGHATLFVQRAGRKIREMAYRFDADAFASQDLSIFSEHITGPGIVQLAYAQEPDSILYCLRADGELISLTYQRDQAVAAWARQPTAGFVESIAAAFDPAGQRDELWVAVRRQVNGEERRFVEYLEAPFSGEDTREAFFVDSGLSYAGEPTTVLTGLDHLAGCEVAVLADGAVLPNQTVSGQGEIVLPRPASKVHAGLPYTSLLEPMRIEVTGVSGTVQTKTKRIVQVTARFHKTLGGRIGAGPDRLETILFRSSPMPMGEAPAVFSGDKSVRFPKGWDKDGRLVIEQGQPLPMTVLMLVPEFALAG